MLLTFGQPPARWCASALTATSVRRAACRAAVYWRAVAVTWLNSAVWSRDRFCSSGSSDRAACGSGVVSRAPDAVRCRKLFS